MAACKCLISGQNIASCLKLPTEYKLIIIYVMRHWKLAYSCMVVFCRRFAVLRPVKSCYGFGGAFVQSPPASMPRAARGANKGGVPPNLRKGRGLAVGFLLRRGRFHLGLASKASAFPSTGSCGGTPRQILQVGGRVYVAVVNHATSRASPFPNRQGQGRHLAPLAVIWPAASRSSSALDSGLNQG